MFDKILIANRGEIACRVIATARRMGIATVAVYSDADAGARHVDEADEAVRIGPAPAAESYLVIDAVVRAAQDTGAQAVHPGYGFLSENAAFAEALDAAHIAFIGPRAAAIAAMGDKIAAKTLAHKAGVETVPGHLGVVANVEQAAEIAADIGYPVMVKASAGGGGRGMRTAHNAAELAEGFARAASEAASSFGDGNLFVEKFIEHPRHIEIQVLADGHGNIVHLGERDCSIQRRHQKVIEEAPSPFVDVDLRAAMGGAAVALARAVDYRSAGTVEFIVDAARNFYFLEMNTRLQVEHPVTEMVTGLDLVEHMIRIAAGEALPFEQGDVTIDGWAIESRLYAEDPMRGFVPSPGRLKLYRPPAASDAVRVDDGVREGDEVTPYYDPLIAKVVTFGATRDEAIAEQSRALDAFDARGIAHNALFLAAIMAEGAFRDGVFDTGFIAATWPDGFHGAIADEDARLRLIAVAVSLHTGIAARAASVEMTRASGANSAPWSPSVSGGVPQGATVAWTASHDGEDFAATAVPVAGGFDVRVSGRTIEVRGDWIPGAPVFRGAIDGAPATVQVRRLAEGFRLTMMGGQADIVVRVSRTAELAALMPAKVALDGTKFLHSPMPGLVVAINVSVGDEVEAGQSLAVVDAMKMENVLNAERKSRIAKVLVAPGDNLSVDQVILEFE
jgi:propionyl-CoA carboxylase alpha chain